MKNVLFVILALTLCGPAVADESRDAKQAQLDGACEVARQKKLIPLRKRFVEECVANKGNH